MFNPGDVVAVDFPGVMRTKRRPGVVISSAAYHTARPDIVVGLVTSQSAGLGPTDYVLQDWAQAGLRIPSVFRCFFATLSPTAHPVLAGHLSNRDWQGISACVRIALDPLGTLETPSQGSPNDPLVEAD